MAESERACPKGGVHIWPSPGVPTPAACLKCGIPRDELPPHDDTEEINTLVMAVLRNLQTETEGEE